MKLKVTLAAALIGIAAIPAVCLASPPRSGAYMSVFLGASAPEDTTITINQFRPVVSSRETQTEFDPGINVGGTAGYDFGFLRLEGEMSYKKGQISAVTDAAHGSRFVNTDGHVGAFALLMNGFFDLHNASPVTPYLGGGIGYTSVNISETKGVDVNHNGTLTYGIFHSDDASAFAYQAGGGVEVAMNRHISLDLGYRYFGTSKVTFTKDWPNSTDMKLTSHNASVGLRVKF